MQAGFAPQAPVALAAIAVLPVLPASFSSATAEPGRSAEGTRRDALPDALDAGRGVGTHGADATLLKLDGPVRVLGGDGQAPAAVRVSDFAPAKEKEPEAPSCRSGDNASLAPLPQGSASVDAQAKERDPDDGSQPVPLPHCQIEFDPEAEDGDVVAGAPAPQPRQGAAEATKLAAAAAKAQVPSQVPVAEKQASGDPAKPAQAPAEAAAAPSQPTATAPQAAAPAHDAPVVITEATKGVGASVIDPLMPTETITFGSDLSLLFPPAAEQAPPPAPAPAAAPSEDPGAVIALPNPDWTLIG